MQIPPRWRAGWLGSMALLGAGSLAAQTAPPPKAALDNYCAACHNRKTSNGGLALDSLDASAPHRNPEVWERVITRLRAATMPPPGAPRPVFSLKADYAN